MLIQTQVLSRQNKLHIYRQNLISGIFIGYVQHAGAGWAGDVFVIDQEEIDNARLKSEVTVKRFKSEEVTVINDGDGVRFPMLEYDVRQHGDAHFMFGESASPLREKLVPQQSNAPLARRQAMQFHGRSQIF